MLRLVSHVEDRKAKPVKATLPVDHQGESRLKPLRPPRRCLVKNVLDFVNPKQVQNELTTTINEERDDSQALKMGHG